MNSTIYRKGTIVKKIDRVNRATRRMSGFDYVAGKPVERTSAEWREELRKLVAHGGHRKHEHGETFGVGKQDRKNPRAVIEFEIYGYVK